MGCNQTTGENSSPHKEEEQQMDLSGYGLPIELTRSSTKQAAGLRITVLVSINSRPAQPHHVHENERTVLLKVRLFDKEQAPPPSVTQLEFCGTTIEDTDTFAQHGVCDNALLQLAFEPSQLTVELWGMMTFTKHKQYAVWSAEPVEAVLARLAKKHDQDPKRLQKLLKQQWYMHVDAGCFSKPVRVNTSGTVQQAGIVDGTRLIPASHAQSFELAEKEKWVHVGMTMKYYGDLVEVKEITDEAGGRKQYVIGHDNQDKRTVLTKLDFIVSE